MSSTRNKLTADAIFHGQLSLLQSRSGYRFTEDAVLLAAFAARGEVANWAVDLGAGCGVVGLMLLHTRAAKKVVAVELQPALASLTSKNAEENSLPSSCLALRADLRASPLLSSAVDLVVSNPPYQKAGAGRTPKNKERALARHEIHADPRSLTREAARLLSTSGRLAVVYPAPREKEVAHAVTAAGLHLASTRKVHPSPTKEPTLVLMEAKKSPARCVELPPFFAREAAGQHSEEMAALLAGQFGRWSLAKERAPEQT